MNTFTDERRLTWAEAKAELLRISTTRGERYSYPAAAGDCHYRWDEDDVADGIAQPEEVGQPACIIGQALSDWGLLDEVIPVENSDAGTFYNNQSAVGEVLAPDLIPVEGQDWQWVDRLLRFAQSQQDRNVEWPLAVRTAIRETDLLIGAAPEDERPEGWAPHQWSE